MVNRKLIRPNLAEVKERFAQPRGSSRPAHRDPDRDRDTHGGSPAAARRRPAPPEMTNAEAFYYLKQMNSQTPMVVVLNDGETLRGQIEWYDRSCLKVHREDSPNVLIYKHTIKYLYKQEDEDA